MPLPEWNPKVARQWLEPHDAREIAARVKRGACQCCGAAGEKMDCGHYRCELCEMRDHFCLACTLAV